MTLRALPTGMVPSMEIVNRQGEPIGSLAAWEQLAPPAGQKQWKDGRSAKELARAYSEGSADEDVVALLTSHPDLAGLELIRAVAERKTQFDDITSGPRNHDLLIEAKVPRGRVVIGVEGKTDEPFDRTLAKYRADGDAKDGSQAPRRLDRLEQLLFGATDLEEEALEDLGYQLLSATAGTLAEARASDEHPEAVAAVLLVHELLDGGADAQKLEANAKTLEAFVTRLSPAADPPRRHTVDDGFVAGPVRIHNDHEALRVPTSMLLYVAKLTTRTT